MNLNKKHPGYVIASVIVNEFFQEILIQKRKKMYRKIFSE